MFFDGIESMWPYVAPLKDATRKTSKFGHLEARRGRNGGIRGTLKVLLGAECIGISQVPGVVATDGDIIGDMCNKWVALISTTDQC